MERIDELACCSDDPSCITRTFGTEAFTDAANLISAWMSEAGLETWIDNIGNVRGRLQSKYPSSKTFVIGSHFDTVINAGKFDGPLGIILAIDLLENLVENKVEIPFNFECVAFSDEEGVRFHTTYLGSKVLSGTFAEELLELKDPGGNPIRTVLTELGKNVEALPDDAIPAGDWIGYYEIHIEQGPVLYERNIPLAVVSGIAAQQRVMLQFAGVSGHAGTVPMSMRQDALCAAAECILSTEKYALEYPDNFVATIGKIEVANSASNVIPGTVSCSLDIRSIHKNILSLNSANLQQLLESICKKRNIGFQWTVIQESDPVYCDQQLKRLLTEAVKENGIEIMEMASGAGHDGVAISSVAPVAMLFVKCYKGISHNPLENVEKKDIASAILVSESFLSGLIKKYQH